MPGNRQNKKRKFGDFNKENSDPNPKRIKIETSRYGRPLKPFLSKEQRLAVLGINSNSNYHSSQRYVDVNSRIVFHPVPDIKNFSKVTSMVNDSKGFFGHENTTPDENNSPKKLTSNTPGKSQFDRVAKVSITFEGQKPIAFYVFQEAFNDYPNFYTKNSYDNGDFVPLEDLKLPKLQNDFKTQGPFVVTREILDASKKSARKPNSKPFNYHSADEIAVTYLGEDAKGIHWEFSHLLRRQQGGFRLESNKEDQASNLSITTAAHNSMRLTCVEEPATKEIKEHGPMEYSVQSNIVKNTKNNDSTHIGDDNETSTWQRDQVKIAVTLNPRSPVPPTKRLAELMTTLYSSLYSKADDLSEQQTNSVSDSVPMRDITNHC